MAPLFYYQSRIRIPFCISTQRTVSLRLPRWLTNTVPKNTLMQNNYLIYRANQWCVQNSKILRFFLFLIGMSIVYSYVFDVSLTGAQEVPSQWDCNYPIHQSGCVTKPADTKMYSWAKRINHFSSNSQGLCPVYRSASDEEILWKAIMSCQSFTLTALALRVLSWLRPSSSVLFAPLEQCIQLKSH